MSIMIAGSPSASPVDGHQAGHADAHHPACPGRGHPPPALPEPDLARYVRTLITRFATHGPARRPEQARNPSAASASPARAPGAPPPRVQDVGP